MPRRLPWAALVASTAAGTCLVVANALRDGGADPLLAARLVAVLLAAAVAGSLEDPSESLTVATPVGRAPLRLVRLMVLAFVVGVVWAGLLLAALAPWRGEATGRGEAIAGRSAAAGLTLELVALGACGLAIASLAVGGERGHGGAAAARGAIGLVVGAALTASIPTLAAWLWADVRASDWAAAHLRWSVVAAVASAGVAWASRDPASRLGLEVRSRSRGGRP